MNESQGAVVLNHLPSKKVEKTVAHFLSKSAKKIPREKIPALLKNTPVVLTRNATVEAGLNVVNHLEKLGASATFIPAKRKTKENKINCPLPLLDDTDMITKITANFLHAVQRTKAQVLLVSSCSKGEGKSTTVLNLAHGLVLEARLKVILIDANPDGHILHRILGVSESPGLTDLLSGHTSCSQAIRHCEKFGFFYLTFGSSSSGKLEPFTGFMGNRFEILLTKLRREFDYVLVDGSALFGPSDSMVIAPKMDGVLLVVECENTRWEVLNTAEEKLRHAGAEPTGVILNRRRYYIPKLLYGN